MDKLDVPQTENRLSTVLLFTLAVTTVMISACDSAGDLAEGTASNGLVTTIRPSADTYVQSGRWAADNFGTSPSLLVDLDAQRSVQQSFLRFAVGDVGPITRATLRLYVVQGSRDSFDVVQVSNTTWTESITWYTRPAPDGPVLASIERSPNREWIDIDVASAVAASSVLSIALVGRSRHGLELGSRESSTPPQLIVESVSSPPDSGASDAGTNDAGTNIDAGTNTDAGTTTPCVADVTIDVPVGGLETAVIQARTQHRAGNSVCLVLRAGAVYRESLILPVESDPYPTTPIIVDGNGATITGADVFTLSPAAGGLLTAVWPHDLGTSSDPWPTLSYDRVLLRREALFIDDGPYIVVDAMAELVPGTFYVDEAADRITINPRAEHASASTAEITVRPLVRDANHHPGLVWLNGRRNVTIRNLIVERATGAVQETMMGGPNGQGWTFENVTVRQAAAAGLGICCTRDIVWRNVDALANGIQALGIHRGTNALIEDSDLRDNNWRGAFPTPGFSGGFTGWAAGTKFGLMDGLTVRRWTSIHNAHHGFWLDWDNSNVLVEDLVSAGNLTRGVFVESNDGPITFRRATVCNNGFSGMSWARSDHVTMEDSRIFDNVGWQHLFTGNVNPIDLGGRLVHGNDFTLRRTVTRSRDDRGNSQSQNLSWLMSMGNRNTSDFYASATFDGNTWWHALRANAFHIQGSTTETYGQFAARVGEINGRWADPGALTCPQPRPPTTIGLPGDW